MPESSSQSLGRRAFLSAVGVGGIAVAAGTGNAYTQPTNLTVSSSGLVTWDLRTGQGVTTNPGDLWTSQVTIEELNPTTHAVISSIPVDYLLQVVSTLNNSPPTVTADSASQVDDFNRANNRLSAVCPAAPSS